jgi:hypothetical protein
MTNISAKLESLRQHIAKLNDSDSSIEDLQYVSILEVDDLFHIDYYGSPFMESCGDLFDVLSEPEVASQIKSLKFRTPDQGANGTCNWDLEPLLSTTAIFTHLESLQIQQNRPSDHNRIIVGESFEENGVLAKLLAKSPALKELTVPSAPNSVFFEIGQHPIRYMNIDAGYDTQNFIFNLSRSSCFPHLISLEWGEYNETYMDMKEFIEHCTPYNHYQELFCSNASRNIGRFVWRNPVCTSEEVKALKNLAPNLELFIVSDSSGYV